MNKIKIVNNAWWLKTKYVPICNENLQKQGGGAPGTSVLDPPLYKDSK